MIRNNNSCIIIAVQARMSSSRLPGKMLQYIHGKPMLAWVVDQLRRTDLGKNVIVATSNEVSDEPIADYCLNYNIPIFRGPLNFVAQRFLTLGQQSNASAIVRICGDSPLIDPTLVNQAVSLFGSGGFDIVTNVFPRSFPKGQSVEVIRLGALEEHISYFDSDDQEHVTRYFYRNHSLFKILNFQSDCSADDIQMSVDTEADLKRVSQIINKRNGIIPQWKDCLKLIEQTHETDQC